MNAHALLEQLRTDLPTQLAVAAAASVLVHTRIFMGSMYSADRWALRADRHKALQGLVYTAAFPLRLLFSLFSAVVATLVWAVLLGGVYALWRTFQG